MDVKKQSVIKDHVSCNFCDDGKLTKGGFGLVFPYEFVYTFGRSSGNGLQASICSKCAKELISKIR